MSFKDFLIENADWMIEVEREGVPHFVNIERDGRVSLVPASLQAFAHSSKWKVKDRALKVLSKLPPEFHASVIQTFGGYVYSSKAKTSKPEHRRSDRG